MRFIEFLQKYKGVDDAAFRAIPEKNILEIQERSSGGCTLFIQEPEGVDVVTSPTPYRNILNQLNGHKPHDYGDVYGIRASEIAAVQEVAFHDRSVEVTLKSGKKVTLSDVSLQEFLAVWRDG